MLSGLRSSGLLLLLHYLLLRGALLCSCCLHRGTSAHLLVYGALLLLGASLSFVLPILLSHLLLAHSLLLSLPSKLLLLPEGLRWLALFFSLLTDLLLLLRRRS